MKKNQIEKSVPSAARRLLSDERGMSTVEYVILLAVIVMGAVSIWSEIGGKIVTALGGSRDSINLLPESEAEAQAQ